MDPFLLLMRLLLATLFAAAGLAKLFDREGSRSALSQFGVPRPLVRPLAAALPLAELAVAGMLLGPGSAFWGALAGGALLVAFTSAIAVNLARGRRPDCHCFGQLHSAPAGPATLARNGLLAAVAGLVAGVGYDDPGPSAVAWLGQLTGAEAAAVAVGAGLLLVAAGGGFAFVHLLRQHGRLLIRLDRLETALEGAGIDFESELDEPQLGLPLGSAAPDFELQSVDGQKVRLADLRQDGLPLALLFTDPECGPCRDLLPSVARWQSDHADRLIISIASGGDAAEVRADARMRGLSHVLVDDGLRVYEAFEAAGTPSAVLIAADGTVASSLAAGSGAIAELVESVVAGEFDVGDAIEGLPVGSPAPELRLPSLEGGTLDLADFRGAEMLILFWNPQCGFCQAMLDDLHAWESDPPPGSPRLLVVSSGSAEETRENGFRSATVIDEAFAVATEFGAAGTPMAVLVDADGRIASPLAVGGEAVMALAGGGLHKVAV